MSVVRTKLPLIPSYLEDDDASEQRLDLDVTSCESVKLMVANGSEDLGSRRPRAEELTSLIRTSGGGAGGRWRGAWMTRIFHTE